MEKIDTDYKRRLFNMQKLCSSSFKKCVTVGEISIRGPLGKNTSVANKITYLNG